MAELVALLTPILWHTVRAQRLDREAAEDVVQSTWLALVRSADSIADPQAVLQWLIVTARRESWRVAKRTDRVEPTRVRGRRRRRPGRATCPRSGCCASDERQPAVAAHRPAARAVPGAAAGDRVRRPARLRRGRQGARHADRQHRSDPRPLPGQAAPATRQRPRLGAVMTPSQPRPSTNSPPARSTPSTSTPCAGCAQLYDTLDPVPAGLVDRISSASPSTRCTPRSPSCSAPTISSACGPTRRTDGADGHVHQREPDDDGHDHADRSPTGCASTAGSRPAAASRSSCGIDDDDSRTTTADADGRFVFDDVPRGLAQFVAAPAGPASARRDHAVDRALSRRPVDAAALLDRVAELLHARGVGAQNQRPPAPGAARCCDRALLGRRPTVRPTGACCARDPRSASR